MKSWGSLFQTIVNITVIFISVISFCGCSETRNQELEKRLVTELIAHKTDDIWQIDLRAIWGNEWKKICIQSPYMLKKRFEELTAETLTDYVGIDDDRYAIWTFHQDGKIEHVDILRAAVMDKSSKGTVCTTLAQPYVYFEIDGGSKKYFINQLVD